MRLVFYRCDECGREERIIAPRRYPDGWRRKTVGAHEVWDLCGMCADHAFSSPLPVKEGRRNRDLVKRLIERLPNANDQQIAEEAWSWGIQMSGETVRRHRNALGIAPARVRRRLRMAR